MTDSTPLLIREDLRQRIEALATERGQSTDEVLEALLPPPSAPSEGNWVRAVAEGMAALDVEWRDEPDAVERSREHYHAYLREKSTRREAADHDDSR